MWTTSISRPAIVIADNRELSQSTRTSSIEEERGCVNAARQGALLIAQDAASCRRLILGLLQAQAHDHLDELRPLPQARPGTVMGGPAGWRSIGNELMVN
jgi:hypothetical protein